MKELLKKSFGLDYRSIAFFRICLAVLVLYDLFARMGDLGTFYTDAGIFTRSDLLKTSHAYRFSIYNIAGTYWAIFCLFIFNIFFAVKFLLGKNTFWSNLIVFVFNISIQNRNWFILNSGDTLLRVFLFWGLFLPMGARWSVDAIKNKAREKVYLAPSGAYAVLQLCLMYWFTVSLKSHDIWVKDFTAVYYALQIDAFATPLGLWLGQPKFYEFHKVLTVGTLIWEYIGPILPFIPFATGYIRGFAVIAFLFMHVSFQLCLTIGIFSTVSLTGWAMFVPTGFWDWLERKKIFRILSGSLFSLGTFIDEFWEWKAPNLKYKEIVATFFFGFVVYFNFSTLDGSSLKRPRWMSNLAQVLRLDQKWEMFAPFPMRDDGWFVMPGYLEDKTAVNVYTFKEEPASFEKPKYVADMQSNMRWRKQILNLRKKEHSQHRLWYAQWLCRTWNKDRKFGKRLELFDIYFMGELTHDNYRVSNKKFLLWSHNCLK